jgi:Zn-dependent M28 family amino/carboxypeptidase
MAHQRPYTRFNPHGCIRYLTVALLLGTVAGCTPVAAVDGPRYCANHAAMPEFDGSRAFEHLRTQVAFGPRVPGSDGHRAQLAWMTEYLRERAAAVEHQSFIHTTEAGELLELTNVIARFHPEARRRVLLLAHWDTRPAAEQDPDPARRREPLLGANDGASGVAVLLELADLLHRHPAPIGVDILLTDGEDYGPTAADMFLGARHFADHKPAAYRPQYGVLLDMVADTQPRFPTEGYSRRYAPEVVTKIWRIAQEIGLGEYFPQEPGGYIMDDHVFLNAAGIPTANIIDFDFGPDNSHWHTHRDDLDQVSAEGLGAVGRVLIALLCRGG